jgi:hypothetical protein
MATAMGHLDQLRKNVRSTRQRKRPSDKEVREFDQDVNPDTNATTNQAFAVMIDMHAEETLEGWSYLDLMGRFPSKITRWKPLCPGPIHGRRQRDHRGTTKEPHRGRALLMHWMDNEVSAGLKSLLTKEFGLAYQLVPPHIHRRNAVEQAIRTFKNHFIAGLCSADNDFPIRLWDKLPQAEITLNLMRASQTDPTKLAAVFGSFDHNQMPLAPPGCKVLIYKKPS